MLRLLLLLVLLPHSVFAQGATHVFVSVLPLKTLVQKLAGDTVVVHSMVGTHQSPATYTPLPSQLKALSEAQLYFRVGVPFESRWMTRIEAQNSNMKVVDLRQGLELRELTAHDHEDDAHEHHDAHEGDAALDPHIWTDPLNIMVMIGRVATELTSISPKQATQIRYRAHEMQQNLLTLHGQITALLQPLQGQAFLVFHPSWGYFAARYGLQQLAIEHQGKVPSARTLAHLIEQAESQKIRVLLIQPQFNQKAAKRVAQAIGAEVRIIDPLSEQFPEVLLAAAQALAAN